MSDELGCDPRAASTSRKTQRSRVLLGAVAISAVLAAAIVACVDPGPSPIGEHFDDAGAGADTATPPAPVDAAGDAPADAADAAITDAADGASAADAHDAADASDSGDADAN